MQKNLLFTLILATALVACGKKEEAAAPETPAPEAAMPAPEAAPEVAMPAPEAAAPAATAEADPGKAKFASVCSTCHGANGEGMGTFPKLAGLTADEVAAKLKDYRAGKQMGAQTAIMAGVAKGLTDDDIGMLAAHIATLK
jgi:cytochrome c553